MNKIEISVAFEDIRGKIIDLVENETINVDEDLKKKKTTVKDKKNDQE